MPGPAPARRSRLTRLLLLNEAMINDPFSGNPFSPTANIGRRLRELYGEAYGDLDERMLELLHQLDFVPSPRREKK